MLLGFHDTEFVLLLPGFVESLSTSEHFELITIDAVEGLSSSNARKFERLFFFLFSTS
jgi:hypothetical protein